MKKFVLNIVAFFAPATALAQGTTNADGFTLIQTATDYVNRIVTFLLAAAILVFVWGVVQYVIAGDEEKKKTGRQHMVWGIIGLFAIVAVWGLVNVIINSTGISNDTAPLMPCPPGFQTC